MPPRVIQFVLGGAEHCTSVTAVPTSIKWLSAGYALVGWIETTPSQYVGRVVVDELVYSCGSGNEGQSIERCVNGGRIITDGLIERLFYVLNEETDS